MIAAVDEAYYDRFLSISEQNQGIFNVWVNVDFRLQLCSELSTVSSAIELYQFLHMRNWAKLYGSIGYCKVLETIYLLTKRPGFLKMPSRRYRKLC